jgi:hypothetical protein
VARRVVTFQSAPRTDQQPEPVIKAIRISLVVIDAIREAASSMANRIPPRR